MYMYKDYQEESMSAKQLILLTVFTMLELGALALAIAACAIPEWIHTVAPIQVTIITGEIETVQTAGLWQICDGGNSSNTVIGGETFTQITSDSCQTGRVVEDFYRSNGQFFETDMFAELVLVRILVMLFIFFAVLKLTTVLVTKCREEPFEHVPPACITCCSIFVYIVEALTAPAALIVYGIILNTAIEANHNQFDNVSDVWGIAYEMFLAATIFSFVSNIIVCFV
eukprot:TRINITY_DN26_c0_g1_i1.p1 TRINITY_DN26_c0_g1~~TRINITY_DN26_c0_g1_i1.p1  ORF type:complete len:227 (-),score=42.13 TRINITY_DN26_c0_g1_i1:1409-2089(-)